MQPLDAEGPHFHTPDSNSSVIRYAATCTLLNVIKCFHSASVCSSTVTTFKRFYLLFVTFFNFNLIPRSFSTFKMTGWAKKSLDKAARILKKNPGVFCPSNMMEWLSLVKNVQGSLKILEDLHEDPSADLWGSLYKILKDLQGSLKFLPRSLRISRRSSRILEGLCMYL